MSLPVFTVGEVLTAALCNSWFIPVVKIKPSDEGPITTTTLQNDNDLILAMEANAIYALDGYLFATGATIGTGDFKMTFTAPAGATYHFTTWGYSTTATTTLAMSAARTSGNAIQGVDGGAASPIIVKGNVTTSSTTGNLTLQWAENTGNATGTTLLTGSWLMLRRIS